MLIRLQSNDALLLDFDGTLVNTATVPDRVSMPPELPDLLRGLAKQLGGALCVVTGRSHTEIRRFVPAEIDVAAEHGAVIDAEGERQVLDAPWPIIWESALGEAEDQFPGLVAERKYSSVVLDYRLNPGLEQALGAFAHQLCSRGPTGFRPVMGDGRIQILRVGRHKGHAVQDIMNLDNYRGRRPIYIGDSAFDFPAFKVARQMGGRALRVNEAFGGKPALVRAWLETCRNDILENARAAYAANFAARLAASFTTV